MLYYTKGGKLTLKCHHKGYNVEILEDKHQINCFDIILVCYETLTPSKTLVKVTGGENHDTNFALVNLDSVIEPDTSRIKIGKIVALQPNFDDLNAKINIEVVLETLTINLIDVEIKMLLGLQAELANLTTSLILSKNNNSV